MSLSVAKLKKVPPKSSGLTPEFDARSDESKSLLSQYIARFQAGDESAFEPLIKLAEPRLKNTVNLIGNKFSSSKEDKEDLYQEFLIRLYKNLQIFDEEKASFYTWTYKIINNLYKTKVDSKESKQAFNNVSLDEIEYSEVEVDQSENRVVRIENLGSLSLNPEDVVDQIMSLEWALQHTSPKFRDVIALSVLDGMNSTEIGEVLKMSPSTVKSQWRLTKNKLHKITNERLLYEDLIVEAAKDVFEQTGKWPSCHDFRIIKDGPMKGETWGAIDKLLRDGGRGLRGGSSLSQLLFRHGLGSNITEDDVLEAAWHVKRETGKRPSSSDKEIIKVGKLKGKSWNRMDGALWRGDYNLPGGATLAQFLDANGLPSNSNNLHSQDIIAAAKLEKKETGKWPSSKNNKVITKGPLEGEVWTSVHTAIRDGYRGLKANGKGLPKFLRDNDCYDRKPNTIDVMFSIIHYEDHNEGARPHKRVKERIDDEGILDGMSWDAVDKRRIGGLTLSQHVKNVDQFREQEAKLQKYDAPEFQAVCRTKSLVPVI